MSAKKAKPASEFHRSSSRRSGLQGRCKECASEQAKNRAKDGYDNRVYATLRRQVIDAYGGECACCGEDEYEFLAIDHVDGGGNQHRKQVGGGSKFLRWLRNNGYPVGFQALCHNCNYG